MSYKNPARVFHFDFYGKREDKYDFLNQESIESIQWTELEVNEPGYFFVDKDFVNSTSYMLSFSVNELFNISGSGTKFRKDNLLVKPHFSQESVIGMINDMDKMETPKILEKYNLTETKDWKVDEQKKYFTNFQNQDIQTVHYRPFDNRFTYFPIDKISMIIPRGDSRKNLMRNLINHDNIGLVICRQQSSFNFQHIFITNKITDLNSISLQTKEQSYIFPLYLYQDNIIQTNLYKTTERTPNLNMDIVGQIAEKLGLQFITEKPFDSAQGDNISFAPIDLLDYIYAVLHSPTYREKYKEFLKIDFPRIPYPKDQVTFWNFVALGGELRQIHLLESPKVNRFITTYPITGNNIVTKPRFEITQSETHQHISTSPHQHIETPSHPLTLSPSHPSVRF